MGVIYNYNYYVVCKSVLFVHNNNFLFFIFNSRETMLLKFGMRR